MSATRLLVSTFTFVLAASACTTSDEEEITKEEARQEGGKSDHGTDYCELYGWYGDGICDDFCPNPDPDCGSTPRVCGGIAGFTCPAGEFCHYEADALCGAADQLGECRPQPSACTRIYDPVCGCDGRTYTNDCEANRAGVSVASRGECGSTEPRTCGGFAGLTCADGEYCHYEPEATCGWADATGECRARPEVCIELYAPVCGCDGRTYDNACKANGAGTSVRLEGPCEADREPVSGMCIKNSGDECASDADCAAGGCGGELCYNPASGGGISTCECTAPVGPSCGCVAGRCSWYE